MSGFGAPPTPATPVKLRIRSFMTTTDDVKPMEVRRPTVVPLPSGELGSETVAAVLAAVWDHSRALWTPTLPEAIALIDGPEESLPLSTPMSRCFRVCAGIAARIARPAHTVSTMIRAPYGGSAILKSPAYGAGATLVLNLEVSSAASTATVVGKREGQRAVKAVQPIPLNIEVVPSDNGWRRKTHSTGPLGPADLEVTLYAIMQALVEVIQKRQ